MKVFLIYLAIVISGTEPKMIIREYEMPTFQECLDSANAAQIAINAGSVNEHSVSIFCACRNE